MVQHLVRGNFAFNTNQFAIQNMYLTTVGKDEQGRLTGLLKGVTVENIKDGYAKDCQMPAG